MICDLTFSSISPIKSLVKVDVSNYSDTWINLTNDVERKKQISCFTLNKLEIEGNFLSQIKGICGKTQS